MSAARFLSIWPRRAAAGVASPAAVTATAGASLAGPAAPAALGRPAVLAAGQAGTRAQVPWPKVGTGWELVQYTTSPLSLLRFHPRSRAGRPSCTW